MCVGLNYKQHAEEANLQIPEHPTIFTKPSTALAGPLDDVPIHPDCQSQLDYEGELTIGVPFPPLPYSKRLPNPHHHNSNRQNGQKHPRLLLRLARPGLHSRQRRLSAQLPDSSLRLGGPIRLRQVVRRVRAHRAVHRERGGPGRRPAETAILDQGERRGAPEDGHRRHDLERGQDRRASEQGDDVEGRDMYHDGDAEWGGDFHGEFDCFSRLFFFLFALGI